MYYKTSEFAKAIGVSTKTLKRWDKAGLLSPERKTEGGHYRYSEEQLKEYLRNRVSNDESSK